MRRRRYDNVAAHTRRIEMSAPFARISSIAADVLIQPSRCGLDATPARIIAILRCARAGRFDDFIYGAREADGAVAY